MRAPVMLPPSQKSGSAMSRNMILVIATTVFRRSGPPPTRPLGFISLPLSIGIVATIISCGTSSATDASDAAPSDTGSDAGADATVDDGVPPPGHCCQSIPGSMYGGCLGRPGPLLNRCPTGYQCLGATEPYCYAQHPGVCEPIPTDCPAPAPSDAVKADCTEHAINYGVTLPPDGIFASECEAHRAGYIWILTPVESAAP